MRGSQFKSRLVNTVLTTYVTKLADYGIVRYRLVSTSTINFCTTLLNMTRHTSASDTSIKERIPWSMLNFVIMSNFFSSEFCKMVLIYRKCRYHATAAQYLHHQYFPRGSHLSWQIIINTIHRKNFKYFAHIKHCLLKKICFKRINIAATKLKFLWYKS